MAQSNLSITLTGQDKLSPMLKDAQRALTELGEKGSRLDDLQATFNKITNSTAPLKKQLRDIQKLMAEMNYEGLDATPLFTQMAEHAGSLADAMGDARTAVNAFANDNFKLEAMAQGMSLVASAGSIATGVMGMFGTENEKVTQAILKVQSALAILNGVQQVANVLNKDSALMLRLKQIRMAANTKVTVADTSATAANSVSLGANTVAAKLANSARSKLNTTIAIGKALMGDWTGLVLVGAAALTTYALATSDSNDKLESQEKATQKATTAIQDYNDKVGGEIGSVISKFKLLQAQYQNLRSEAEKVQFIKDNESAFKQLGIAIKDVTDAQKAFVENSDKVIEALTKQAMARAALAAGEDKLKEYYSDKRNTHHIQREGGITNRNQLSRDEDKKALDEGMKAYMTDKQYKQYQKTGEVPLGQQYYAQKVVNDKRDADSKASLEALEKENQALVKAAALNEKSADDILKALGLQVEADKKGGKGGSSSNKPKTDLEVYKEYEQKAKELEQKYKVGLISKEEAEKGLEAINAKIKEKFGENAKPLTIDLGLKKDLEIYSDLSKLVQEVQQKYNLGLISEDKAKEEIEKINNLLKEKLGDGAKEFKLQVKPVVEAGSLNAIKKEISELQEKIANMDISLDPAKFQEYLNKLIQLEKQAENLENATSTDPAKKEGTVEYKRAKYDDTMSKIQQVGSDLKMGIITDQAEAQSQVDKLIADLQKTIPDLELKMKVRKDGTVEEVKNEAISLKDAFGMAGQAMQGFAGALQNIDPENEGLQKGALIAQAIGSLALSFAQAMASPATTSTGVWGWVAAGISGLATLTTMIASMQSFSTGGVVAGGNYTGDHVLARLNSGEGVLTRRGMNTLNQVMDQADGVTTSMAGKVEFDIDGTKLKGVLNNTNRKLSKQS